MFPEIISVEFEGGGRVAAVFRVRQFPSSHRPDDFEYKYIQTRRIERYLWAMLLFAVLKVNGKTSGLMVHIDHVRSSPTGRGEFSGHHARHETSFVAMGRPVNVSRLTFRVNNKYYV